MSSPDQTKVGSIRLSSLEQRMKRADEEPSLEVAIVSAFAQSRLMEINDTILVNDFPGPIGMGHKETFI